MCKLLEREMEMLQNLWHNYKQVVYKVIYFIIIFFYCYNLIPLKFGLLFFRQQSTVSKFSTPTLVVDLLYFTSAPPYPYPNENFPVYVTYQK